MKSGAVLIIASKGKFKLRGWFYPFDVGTEAPEDRWPDSDFENYVYYILSAMMYEFMTEIHPKLSNLVGKNCSKNKKIKEKFITPSSHSQITMLEADLHNWKTIGMRVIPVAEMIDRSQHNRCNPPCDFFGC